MIQLSTTRTGSLRLLADGTPYMLLDGWCTRRNGIELRRFRTHQQAVLFTALLAMKLIDLGEQVQEDLK